MNCKKKPKFCSKSQLFQLLCQFVPHWKCFDRRLERILVVTASRAPLQGKYFLDLRNSQRDQDMISIVYKSIKPSIQTWQVLWFVRLSSEEPTLAQIFRLLIDVWQACDRWLHYLATPRWLYTNRYAWRTFRLIAGSLQPWAFNRTSESITCGGHLSLLLIDRSDADFCKEVFCRANPQMISCCAEGRPQSPCLRSGVPAKKWPTCSMLTYSTAGIDYLWSWETLCTQLIMRYYSSQLRSPWQRQTNSLKTQRHCYCVHLRSIIHHHLRQAKHPSNSPYVRSFWIKMSHESTCYLIERHLDSQNFCCLRLMR